MTHNIGQSNQLEHIRGAIISFITQCATEKDGILTLFFGFGCKDIEMAEIAELRSCSRQNVHSVIKGQLKKLGVTPSSLSQTILRSWNNGTFEEDFHSIEKLFHNTLKFYKFMSLSSGLNPKSFQPETTLKSASLFCIFSQYKSPIELNVALESIDAENGNIHNLVKKCVSEGYIALRDHKLYAEYLPRKFAFCQAALDLAKPATPHEIMAHADKLGLLSNEDKTAKTYNRLLKECANDNAIYSCDKGKFLHTTYFPISSERVHKALAEMREILESSNSQPIDIRQIQAQTSDSDLTYFELRYIARNYGKSVGIYFSGQSQNDTIALTESFDAPNQIERIKRWLDDKATVTFDDIKSLVRTRTGTNTSRVIQTLSEQNVLHPLSRGKYEVVKNSR
ncbi:hypothetical protein ASL83_003459 [Vibrio parahaemolyticus]|nr:hypothetical protein [Vibrio parahaemolyticus]